MPNLLHAVRDPFFMNLKLIVLAKEYYIIASFYSITKTLLKRTSPLSMCSKAFCAS
jgi:hypothetical protein